MKAIAYLSRIRISFSNLVAVVFVTFCLTLILSGSVALLQTLTAEGSLSCGFSESESEIVPLFPSEEKAICFSRVKDAKSKLLFGVTSLAVFLLLTRLEIKGFISAKDLRPKNLLILWLLYFSDLFLSFLLLSLNSGRYITSIGNLGIQAFKILSLPLCAVSFFHLYKPSSEKTTKWYVSFAITVFVLAAVILLGIGLYALKKGLPI